MTHTTKHTPGPWIIDAVKFVTTPKAVVIAELNDGLNGEFADSGYWQQNATLIAAAPAMYEALKAILDSENSTLGDGGSILGDDYRSLLQTALAQAEGGGHE